MLIGVLSKQTQIGAVNPLLFLGIGIFAVAFIILSFVSIPEPNLSNGRKIKYSHSLEFPPYGARRYRYLLLCRY